MEEKREVDVEQQVVNEEPEETTEDSFSDLEQFFLEDDETDVEPEEEEPEEEVAEETAEETEEEVEEEVEEPQPEQPKSLTDRLSEHFTQEEMNQLFGGARIQGRELHDKVQALQQMTGGMNLDQIIDHLRNQQVEQYESEYGVPRQEAERFIEDRQVRGYLEQELLKLHQQQQMTATMASYNNEKARFINNPLVKKYEADIDAVSQGGQRLGFEAAMKYVLGEKTFSGEISQNIKDSTQQRVIKNASRKPTRTPEGSGSGGAQTNSVPPGLKQMAALFGNDPKSVAQQYQKIQRTPKR